MTLQHARITGVGAYLPPKVISNDQLATMVDTSNDWIVSRTGIYNRHVVEDESCTDLAYESGKVALENAGLKYTDIDAIIVATVSGDYAFPSVATLVAHRMGIAVPAYDVAAACAGFIFALRDAHNMIMLSQAKRILVIGVDLFSRMMDWYDRNTCILFGDGAGAVVVEQSATNGVLSTHIFSDGHYTHDLIARAKPHAPNDSTRGIDMDGKSVYKFAINAMSDAILKALEYNNMALSDVDWVVPHQANVRIIKAVSNQLQVPIEKVVVSLQDHANISAATVPVALHYAHTKKMFKNNDIIALTAMGAGFSWGSALIKW